jgi:hypothetical protein
MVGFQAIFLHHGSENRDSVLKKGLRETRSVVIQLIEARISIDLIFTQRQVRPGT